MMKTRTVTLLIIVSVALSMGTGCSRYKPPPIDISKGEYYEEEEYQKLSKKDREKYCADLAVELEDLQGRSETAQQQLADNKERIKQLQKELRDAEREYATMTAHIDELTKQIEELEGLPRSWVFEYGECLWTVASYEEVYGDPLKWPRLWRGNARMIEDPDWVLAGWEIKIPRDWPRRHLVIQDEWLSKIAGYWEVYDNFRDWPKLYEANKGAIEDPDLIFPEQELVIPR
jgi:nucleoid-associated protein YgaU